MSKTAFPDPPQLLRMQMKCIAGGRGSPGRAGASANTFKQIAVKGGNRNVASNLPERMENDEAGCTSRGEIAHRYQRRQLLSADEGCQNLML